MYCLLCGQPGQSRDGSRFHPIVSKRSHVRSFLKLSDSLSHGHYSTSFWKHTCGTTTAFRTARPRRPFLRDNEDAPSEFAFAYLGRLIRQLDHVVLVSKDQSRVVAKHLVGWRAPQAFLLRVHQPPLSGSTARDRRVDPKRNASLCPCKGSLSRSDAPRDRHSNRPISGCVRSEVKVPFKSSMVSGYHERAPKQKQLLHNSEVDKLEISLVE
jgi:hypothetical protein